MHEHVLIIAHPGHELRLFHWMERHEPVVFVLTDGSGGAAGSRISATADILRAASATPGPWFGAFTDRELYRMIIECDAPPLADLTRQLAEFCVQHRPAELVGDMIEGYSPCHDVCRAMIDAAVELANAQNVHLANFAFPLTGLPDMARQGRLRPAQVLRLDPAAIERKRRAAEGYVALRAEVDHAWKELGMEAFACEALYDASTLGGDPPEQPPSYESFGERQVALGRYDQVLRYRGHVQPLVAALRRELALS